MIKIDAEDDAGALRR